MTYDSIGNLTSYAGWTYTWAEGRRLVKQVQNARNVTYAYDASGLRVKKTYNSTVYDYTWSGDRLVHLRAGSNDLHFFYDEAGTPSMMLFNNVPYRYVKNLQGDIISIVDTSGTTVVEYKYDPWGKKESRTGSLSGTVGYYNPFRYRGYIFDEETWMYYLKDRYYYPELRRFINADRLTGCIGVSISHNLFAYCINSPTMYKDPWGLAPAELTAFPEVPKDIANIMEQAGYSIPDFPAQFQGVSPINYQEVSKGFITVEFSQTTYEDTIFGPQVHYRTYQYVIDVDQNRSLEKTYNKWFKNAATDSMIDALSSISMDGIALVHMICPPIAAQWDTIMFVVGAVKTALDEVMDESVYQPFSATIFHRIVPKYLREYTYREIIN